MSLINYLIHSLTKTQECKTNNSFKTTKKDCVLETFKVYSIILNNFKLEWLIPRGIKRAHNMKRSMSYGKNTAL